MATKADDSWKQKYLDAIEELESSERKLGKVENLMRRGISRLTLAAEGVRPELDRPLAELRSAVRKDVDETELNRLFDVISGTLKQLDARRRVSVLPPPAPNEILGALLDALRLPSSQRASHSRLRVQLSAQAPADSADTLVQAVARMLNESLSGAGLRPAVSSDEAHSSSSGVVGVSPADSGVSTAVAMLRRVVEQLPAPWQSASTTLVARLDRLHAPAELDRFTTDLVTLLGTSIDAGAETASQAGPTTAEALTRLIDLLAVPQELRPRQQALRERLRDARSPAEWMDVLAGLAGLIAEMRARVEAEKSGLESFLRRLTERLGELDQHLKGAEAERRRAQAGSSDLDAVMDKQMRGIESSVQAATSLDQLKSSVQERVEDIRTHLAEHRRREVERQTRLQSQLDHATARLHGLEAEATDLRASLRQQRAQAMSDVVTGVANRAAFDERIEQEFERRHGIGAHSRCWSSTSIASSRSMIATGTRPATRRCV